MDYVPAEHSIDISIEKIAFRGVPAQIVLCTSMKALRKGGTSVTVYQSNGNMLGCKEEFRIFSKTYSDGTVNEDFNVDDETLINRVEECQEEEDYDDLRDDSFHMDHEEMVPEAILPEPESELSTRIPEMTALPLSPSLPITTKECRAAVRPTRKKNFDWEPFPFDVKVVCKPLKIIDRIAMHEMLESEETVEADQTVKSRKRKRKKDKEVDKVVETVKLTWIDMAIKDGSVDANNNRIQLEIENRKKLCKSRAKAAQSNILDDQLDHVIEAEDDHEPDDFEGLIDDNDAAICSAPLTQVEEIISEELPDLYGDEALKAIEKFKENRREHANRATEVAKRVAAWHESIMPVLDAAESRSKFDVHEYGSRILTVFPDGDHKSFRPFRNVVVEQPKNEICRYFLSTLMLANTYNLEIRKSEPGPLVKDCVELRLITKVRHHEEMDEALRVTSEECGS
uniref:Condensin-2 complex subunit H2 n=1 Tax=Lygus hesperus TaxID=30085 RepID=A0A0A9W646_LYGHE